MSTVTDAVVRAIGEMEATGTAGIGDIGNTDAAVLPRNVVRCTRPLPKQASPPPWPDAWMFAANRASALS